MASPGTREVQTGLQFGGGGGRGRREQGRTEAERGLGVWGGELGEFRERFISGPSNFPLPTGGLVAVFELWAVRGLLFLWFGLWGVGWGFVVWVWFWVFFGVGWGFVVWVWFGVFVWGVGWGPFFDFFLGTVPCTLTGKDPSASSCLIPQGGSHE